MTVTVEIPMTLPSMSNTRLHWAVKAKRVKAQRAATLLALKTSRPDQRLDDGRVSPDGKWLRLVVTGLPPLVVTLTRVAPRKLDDDNNVSAFKAVRDSVAAYFGVDDADPRISWVYRQAKGPAAVRIEFSVEAS